MSNQLYAEAILDLMLHPEKNSLSMNIADVVDSTNNYLKRPGCRSGETCIANKQTAGRGRHANKWHSPSGRNVYLSMLWEFAEGTDLRALSLMTSMSVTKSLREAGFDVGIKWPNDIFTEGGKIGGILIDTVYKKGGGIRTIIGIGLNVKDQTFPGELLQPATWLESLSTTEVSRNRIAAIILDSLLTMFDLSPDLWLTLIKNEWANYDITLGKMVLVTNGGNKYTGEATGVNESLQFGLYSDGQQKYFDDWDSSVKLI